MADFCVLGCGGFGVSAPGSCAGVGGGDWGTDVLKMAASCMSAVVCFYPRCVMGMDGVGFYSDSVKPVTALVTTSTGNSFGKFFWSGNSSVVSYTRYGAVLGM